MSTNKVVLIGVLAVIALAGTGAAVQLVPWLREHRNEISLLLLMLLLVGSGFTVAVALLSTLLATSTPDDIEPQQWRCPGCDEPVRPCVPTDLIPAGEWSHLDGTQLCPEIGPNGYRPADPISSRTTPTETA